MRNYTWTVHDKVKTVIFEDPAGGGIESSPELKNDAK